MRARRRIRSTPSPTAISCWRHSSACAIAAVHLSRFAEEIVLWSSPLVGLVKLSDKFTTGSSIMPQKRNPDAAELVRARAGRIVGALDGTADGDEGTAARLSEGYAGGQGRRDRCASARWRSRSDAMTGMVGDMEPDVARMRQAAGEGFATATDLADWLTRTLKLPFREAHHVTGQIVAKAAAAGRRAG